MLPRTPLRSLSHSWSGNNGRKHSSLLQAKQGDDPLLHGDSGATDSSTAAKAVARYRARQFNRSWSRSTPEHIGGVDFGTPYIHQTPAGKPRLDWTASADESGDAQTPVLRPEYTPCLSLIHI